MKTTIPSDLGCPRHSYAPTSPDEWAWERPVKHPRVFHAELGLAGLHSLRVHHLLPGLEAYHEGGHAGGGHAYFQGLEDLFLAIAVLQGQPDVGRDVVRVRLHRSEDYSVNEFFGLGVQRPGLGVGCLDQLVVTLEKVKVLRHHYLVEIEDVSPFLVHLVHECLLLVTSHDPLTSLLAFDLNTAPVLYEFGDGGMTLTPTPLAHGVVEKLLHRSART